MSPRGLTRKLLQDRGSQFRQPVLWIEGSVEDEEVGEEVGDYPHVLVLNRGLACRWTIA